jgi:hypothetical protein
MIETAGFENAKYRNLSMGIAALHSGWKSEDAWPPQHLAPDPHGRHAGTHRCDGCRAGRVRGASILRLVARILGKPFMWLGYQGDPSMPPATRALTALGPAYIKFGQVLSTRPDVVGPDLAAQLRVLQDKLPPFPVETAKAEIRKELGQPVEVLFSEFSEPIAAASMAQVHKARVARTGEAVAVKVLRPGIERAFRTDIDAFYLAARIVELAAPGARRLRPMDVITHFDGVVRGELDLRLESAAASEFAANTVNDTGFRTPPIVWDLSARRVMTLAGPMASRWATTPPSTPPATTGAPWANGS